MNAWTIDEIEKVLVDARWPAISPWWWDVIRSVDDARARGIRNYGVRGGRRGGKSSTIAGRIAIREVLSKLHTVPPGDTGYFAIISADKDQAQERLDTCHAALKALGIGHRKTANEITLTEPNQGGGYVGIKAFAATLSAVVSFTSIGFLCDEMARWRDKDGAVISAKGVLTSLRATGATMPNAMNWYVSAPWSTLDEHHEMVEKGDNETQVVFIGATWEMNPTITEAMTYALEPDEPSRLREYGAIPMSSDEANFFPAEFVEACRTLHIHGDVDRVVAGADFAFRRNSSAMVALDVMGDGKMRVASDEERRPGVRALVPSETITDLCGIARDFGAEGVACDLHYVETVREHTDELGIDLLEFPSQEQAIPYVRLRVLLAQKKIGLANASDKLIKQLKECTGKPTQTGITISNKLAADGSHGDILSALVCALWAVDQEVGAGRGMRSGGERRFARGDDESDADNAWDDDD